MKTSTRTAKFLLTLCFALTATACDYTGMRPGTSGDLHLQSPPRVVPCDPPSSNHVVAR